MFFFEIFKIKFYSEAYPFLWNPSNQFLLFSGRKDLFASKIVT